SRSVFEHVLGRFHGLAGVTAGEQRLDLCLPVCGPEARGLLGQPTSPLLLLMLSHATISFSRFACGCARCSPRGGEVGRKTAGSVAKFTNYTLYRNVRARKILLIAYNKMLLPTLRQNDPTSIGAD